MTLSVLPTLLTLGNGVCGLAAIAVAMSVNLPWDHETKLLVAGSLIFAGMLFDALDGSAARMTGQESRFGAELDSLCDAVTFGTAPAVIVWRYADGQAIPLKLSWAIGVLFALCVLIRLARFNVETDEDDTHEGFDGLPSPAAAGTIAAFAIAMPELAVYATDALSRKCPVVCRAVARRFPVLHRRADPVAGLLDGLTVPVSTCVPTTAAWSSAPHQIGQALFVVIGALVLHWLALPIAFCYYAFASPTRTLMRRWKKPRAELLSPS